MNPKDITFSPYFLNVLICVFLHLFSVHSFAAVRYVSEGGTGDGSSWANASGDLQAMIDSSASGDEVWVAAGIYKPTNGNDRSASFVLRSGVAIFGGFAGTESLLIQRNLLTNPTILSGDIGTIDDPRDNSYSVVRAQNVNSTAILDGFIIRDGNANEIDLTNPQSNGGGIYVNTASPTLSNLIIRQNQAGNDGAGIFSLRGNLQLSNIVFYDNAANRLGGGFYGVSSSSITCTHCTFASNTAQIGGGATGTVFSTTNLINSIIWGNSSSIYNDIGGITTVTNSLTESFQPGTGNISLDPLFVDIDSGNLDLLACSPAINTGDFQLNFDVLGRPRNTNGGVDMGAYEFQGSIALCECITNNRLYVNATNTSNLQNGFSWATAFTDLQDAISLARSCNGVSEIWVAAGTYKPSEWPVGCSGCETNRDFAFLLINGVNLYGGFNGSESQLSERDIDANKSILSGDIGIVGDPSDNVHHVVLGVGSNVRVDGFTVTGGNANGESNIIFSSILDISRSFGGGVHLRNGNYILTNNTISDNTSTGRGGGVYARSGSNSPFTNNLFSGNSANDGGAVYLDLGSNEFSGNTFTENLALNQGGGLFSNFCSCTITENFFSNNTSNLDGGGAFVNQGVNVFQDNIVSGNTAINNGGGLFSNFSSFSVLNNEITNNTATRGAGFYGQFGANTISNNTLAGNLASIDGGGAFFNQGNNTLIDNMVTGNSASNNGGGVFSNFSTCNLTNNLIIGNAANNGGCFYGQFGNNTITNSSISGNVATTSGGAAFFNQGNNTIANSILWGNSSEIFSIASNLNVSNSVVQGGFSGVSNLDLNPLFEAQPMIALGATGNLQLQECSPAINTGNNNAVPVGVATDINGNDRFFGGTVDMGAYEFQGSVNLCDCIANNRLYVNQSNDLSLQNGLSWATAFADLQDAIALVGTCPDVTEIWVAEGTYYPTSDPNNRAASFNINPGLALYGGFSGVEDQREQRNWNVNKTILSGDINQNGQLDGNSIHVLNASCSSPEDPNCHNPNTVLDGFIVTMGNADGSFNDGAGAGMISIFGRPNIKNCIFRNNSASFGGGAIYNFAGKVTVENTLFHDNLAGLPRGSAFFFSGTEAKIVNATFAANAQPFSGGTFYCEFSTSLEISNSIMWNNGFPNINLVSNSNAVVSHSIIELPIGVYPGVGNLNVDPLFEDESTSNFNLTECSQAINAGINAAISAETLEDLNANPRIFNDIVDIGVYEFQDDPKALIANCQDRIIELDGTGSASLSASALDAGSVGCGVLIFSVDGLSDLTFTCSDIGLNSVTLTVTDERGLTATCIAMVSVEDNTPPFFTCPQDQNVNLTEQCQLVVPDLITDLIGSDNCGIVTFQQIPTPNTAIDSQHNSPITVTITANDGNGNTASCTVVLTGKDITPPQIITDAQDLTVECDGAGNLSARSNWLSGQGGAVSTDNCSDVVWSNDFSEANFVAACGATGSVIVTFTATDAAGLINQTTATFTIVDTQAPNTLINASSQTVECDGAGNLAMFDEWLSIFGGFVAEDVCGTVSYSFIPANPQLSNLCGSTGAVTVTFVATDECGNSSTSVATFTIEDTFPPIQVIAASNVTVECDGFGNSAAFAAWLSDFGGYEAVDICSDVTFSTIPTNPQLSALCGATGSVTVTFVATDDCGNSSTSVATFTIEDTLPPSQITAASNETVECDGSGNTTAFAAWLANFGGYEANDICSDVTYSTIPANPQVGSGCGVTGSVNVTFVATDACGNSSQSTATFSIVDTENPILTVTDPVYAGLQSGDVLFVECQSADPSWEIPAGLVSSVSAIDVCGTVALAFTESIAATYNCNQTNRFYDLRRSWIATDACGNQDSIFFIVRVGDTTAPVISNVPIDITIGCEDLPAMPPMVDCDSDPSAFADPTAVQTRDACECARLSVEELIEGDVCADSYYVLRVWTAVDNCGLISQAVQRITIIKDQTLSMGIDHPILGSLANGSRLHYSCTEEDGISWIGALTTESVTVHHPCAVSEVEVTFDIIDLNEPGTCEERGYLQRLGLSWIARDACGEIALLYFEVEVTNSMDPQIQGERQVCNMSEATIEVSTACGSSFTSSFTDRQVASSCVQGGTDILRSWLVRDECGNTASFDQLILSNTGEEQISILQPLIGSADVVVVSCDVSFSPADVLFRGVCGDVLETVLTEEIISEDQCFEGAPLYVKRLTWSVIDICGGMYNVSQVIERVDTEAPVFADLGATPRISCVGDWVPKVEDNCGGPVGLTLIDITVIQEETCAQSRIEERTYSASDACGNTSEATYTVEIVFNQGVQIQGMTPVLYCEEAPEMVTAVDACTGISLPVTFTDQEVPNGCGDGRLIRRTWRAVNDCGVAAVRTQLIYLDDETAPEMAFRHPVWGAAMNGDILFIECADADAILEAEGAIGEGDVQVINECEFTISLLIEEGVSANCVEDGYLRSLFYTWQAIDPCGNVGEFVLEVRIRDTQAPVFVNPPSDLTLYCEVITPMSELELTDACSPIEQLMEEEILQVGRVDYILRRRWIAKDACGNKTEHVQDILFNLPVNFSCNITGEANPVCNSRNNTLQVQVNGGVGPLTYQWIVEGGSFEITSGQGTPSITYTMGFNPGAIGVIVTDARGCQLYCSVDISCLPLGFEAPDAMHQTAEIQVFPNPAETELNVLLGMTYPMGATLEILHLGSGIRVHFQELKDMAVHQSVLIQLGQWVSGIYLLEMKDKESGLSHYVRFVKL